ncbi:hypothetical protein V8C86DRAFT_207982 [Haematococcus lacustris]
MNPANPAELDVSSLRAQVAALQHKLDKCQAAKQRLQQALKEATNDILAGNQAAQELDAARQELQNLRQAHAAEVAQSRQAVEEARQQLQAALLSAKKASAAASAPGSHITAATPSSHTPNNSNTLAPKPKHQGRTATAVATGAGSAQARPPVDLGALRGWEAEKKVLERSLAQEKAEGRRLRERVQALEQQQQLGPAGRSTVEPRQGEGPEAGAGARASAAGVADGSMPTRSRTGWCPSCCQCSSQPCSPSQLQPP